MKTINPLLHELCLPFIFRYIVGDSFIVYRLMHAVLIGHIFYEPFLF